MFIAEGENQKIMAKNSASEKKSLSSAFSAASVPPSPPTAFSSEEEKLEYYKNLSLYWETYAHQLEEKIAKKKACKIASL